MIKLHVFQNNYVDEEEEIHRDCHVFVQKRGQQMLDSQHIEYGHSLRDVLRQHVIDECLDEIGDREDPRYRKVLMKALEEGDIPKLLKFADRLNLICRSTDDSSQTFFGSWEYQQTEIEPSSRREQQQEPWSFLPAYPHQNWKMEVAADRTNLGYWEWVEEKQKALGTAFVIYNKLDSSFWNNDSGWGCFATALRVSEKDRDLLNLPVGGEWVKESDALPWRVGNKVTWTDSYDEDLTHTGVIARIDMTGYGRVSISMEDGWESEVDVCDLSAAEEMVTLRFRPQVWRNDQLIEAIAIGKATWQVPLSHILSLFKDYHEWMSKDEERNNLRRFPGTPTWIHLWEGPFQVEFVTHKAVIWKD